MRAFFLVLVLAAAVWGGQKGNLAYKQKQVEKWARSIGTDLNLDIGRKKEEKR